MRRQVHATRIAVLSCATLMACLVTAAKRFDVSSLRSDYTPAGRIWGQATATDSVISVHIDSLLVAVPGFASPGAPPAVGKLNLRVLVAVADTPKWRPLEVSDPIALIDTLHFGEQRILRNVLLRLAMPRGVALEDAFLVFEFRGQALQRDDLRESVRTFVCSAENLRGRTAASRARAVLLESSYMRVC